MVFSCVITDLQQWQQLKWIINERRKNNDLIQISTFLTTINKRLGRKFLLILESGIIGDLKSLLSGKTVLG